jgi:putative ABC transport system permease protein
MLPAMTPLSRRIAQLRVLVPTFLVRFFENELTSGTDDLKTAFFGLLAVLAIPGFILPILMAYASAPIPAASGGGTDPAGWGWILIARYQGAEVLRVISRADKTFYLGFAMIASGIVSASAWSTLLVDRRDGLILGTMPVAPTTIVAAKLAALAAYVSIVAATMHALASFSFGSFLASGNTFGFAVRGMAAHFLASFAASVFVMMSVAAAQGLALAACGPRLFTRVSAALHVCLVALVLISLILLPTISGSVVSTLGGNGSPARSWILATPPLWFLGLYEQLLGTTNVTLLDLSRTAMISLAAIAAATLGAYPLAYRRLMIAVADQPAGGLRPSATAISIATTITGRDPDVRAVAQFFLTTLSRHHRHRLVMSSALGIAAAWGLPGWVSLAASPPAPTLGLLSWAVTTPLFLLIGLRVAALIPGDLRAAWIFDSRPPAWRQARHAVERTMFGMAVLPIVTVFVAAYWWMWGAQVALVHAVFSLAMGALVAQALLWRFDGVPCARPWNPASLGVSTSWPVYLAILLTITPALPGLELLLLGRPILGLCLAFYVLALAMRLRAEALRRGPVSTVDPMAVLASALMVGRESRDVDSGSSHERVSYRSQGFFEVYGTRAAWFDWHRIGVEIRRSSPFVVRDLRLALRRLRAAPIFTLFSVATLGCGIGVTTTVYSLVYSLLWAPPPIHEPDRVLELSGANGRRSAAFSWPDYQDLHDSLTTIRGLSATRAFRLPFVAGSVGESLFGETVNGEYFQTFGLRPVVGRLIQIADDEPNAPPVVVLSYPLWRLRFGMDPRAVGRLVKIDGRVYEIVGVAPQGFRGWDFSNLSRSPDVWVPFSTGPDEVRDSRGRANRDVPWLVVKGRLAPGRTVKEAKVELAALGRGLETTYPTRAAPGSPRPSWLGRRWSADPIRDRDDHGLSSLGSVFIGAVAVVLLIGCTNLANLALARGSAREHEVSVRRALGASRVDLVREQLVESGVVAIAGGFLAALIIRTFMTSLAMEIPAGPGRFVLLDPHLSVPVLVFAAGAGLCALVIFAVWPALQLTRTPIRDTLSTEGGTTPPHWRMHRRLIGWQVAASVALFLIAAACINVIVGRARHDPGVDVDRLAFAEIDFEINRYDPARTRATLETVLSFAAQRPEIASIAASGSLPFGAGLPGRWLAANEPVQFVPATSQIFSTLGVPVVRGRGFDARDTATTPLVAVVNNAFALRTFGTSDAVGRELVLSRAQGNQRADPPTRVAIVGVAADTDAGSFGSRENGVVYVPLAQHPQSRILLTARSSGDLRSTLAALRSVLRGANPDLVIERAETGSLFLAGPYVVLEFIAALITTLGALALLLAMTGLFGVVSHVVSRRTRELGVRLALGAGRHRIMRLVFIDGLRPVVDGLVIGLFAGAVCRSIIAATISGRVSAVDPIAFVIVPILFVATALCACYFPARRAARVDPNVALRQI